LATVKVSTSTLLSDHPGDAAQQRELLQIIDEEADRMKQWIDEAVQMSSREASDLRLRKTPSPVKEVVGRAMQGFGMLLDDRPVEVEISESLPHAVCDAEMIEKVIRQLLDNAIKYSPPGSPIRVSAEFTGAEIVISVADSGRGIPKGDQQRIFEKYYRGRNGGSDVPGTGLGLPSVKCILEAHGGEIWVHSDPGSGSIFRFSLPVMPEASPE
jgi:two-component system sensor histidine kinase KdpD